jgi:chromosome segregation protein
MHLKTMNMTGFKSFAEAKIEFPEGVTAIVGPNGSGKSNVVDAILWVLGEQSTKTLRSEKTSFSTGPNSGSRWEWPKCPW